MFLTIHSQTLQHAFGSYTICLHNLGLFAIYKKNLNHSMHVIFAICFATLNVMLIFPGLYSYVVVFLKLYEIYCMDFL